MKTRSFVSIPVLVALALIAALPSGTKASERRFTYSYEATTMPKGLWEFEQWLTWKGYDDKDRLEFRHEIEYGLTDHLQVALYLSDWRLTKPDDGETEAEWRTAGAEVIYQLTDPTKDPIGSALYGEFKLGPEKFALEGKLLLQKNFGPLALVYNFVLEAEWEGADYEEEIGVIQNTAGISYQISPSFLIGAEALHEVEFEGWEDAGDNVLSVGPNISFRKGSFFTTVTGLFQVTDVDGEPEQQVRMLAGFHF
jgi:hypothetical protein